MTRKRTMTRCTTTTKRRQRTPRENNRLSEAIHEVRTGAVRTMGTQLARTEEAAGTGLVNWQVMREQSEVLLKSGFLPKSITSPEQAMAIILTGQELGLPAMQALRGITVIQGQPTIKPELMLALCVNRIPGFTYSLGACTNERAEFTCSRPGMSKPYISVFTMEDAKRAGLSGKGGAWTTFPGNMLRWRAVGNGLHISCPDVLVGIYTADEITAGSVTVEGEVIDVPAYGETRDLQGALPAQVIHPVTGEVAPQPASEKQKSDVKLIAMAHFNMADPNDAKKQVFDNKGYNAWATTIIGTKPDHKPYRFGDLSDVQADALIYQANVDWPPEPSTEFPADEPEKRPDDPFEND